MNRLLAPVIGGSLYRGEYVVIWLSSQERTFVLMLY